MSLIRNISNKLIAEFMGNKWTVDDLGVRYESTIHSEEIRNPINLKYDKSWDWLIPVIDKIYSSNEYISYKNEMSGIFNEEPVRINTKYIEETHKAVIEFVKWYNKQK